MHKEKLNKTAFRDDTNINVENDGSPQTAKYTMGEKYNNVDTQRQRLLVLFFAIRGGYKMEATTSLSLSLYTHVIYKCNNIQLLSHKNVCPKSYLYIYDFRVIYICVPTNRSDGSKLGLRSFGSP